MRLERETLKLAACLTMRNKFYSSIQFLEHAHKQEATSYFIRDVIHKLNETN